MVSEQAIRFRAARLLLPHVTEMLERLAGVKRGDAPEDLHQMRVASRRLRSGLRLFQEDLEDPAVRSWLRAIRRITRRLGKARDTDVQLEFLKEYRQGLSDEHKKARRAGLDRLMLRLSQKRESQQKKIRRTLKHLADTGILEDIQNQCNRWKVQAELATEDPEASGQQIHSPRHIRALVEDLLSLEPRLFDPEAWAEHHQMRLVAKRLRYTLEYQPPDIREAIAPALQQIRQMQKHLGRLHDLDLWIVFLPKFLKKEQRRHIEFHGNNKGFASVQRGIQDLAEDLHNMRRRQYESLLAFWKENISLTTWKDLLAGMEAGSATFAPDPDPSGDPGNPAPPSPPDRSF